MFRQKGHYGERSHFGLPIFPSFEGDSETAVNVPITGETLGDPVSFGTRNRFGPFWNQGDSTGIDWLGGGVSRREGWSLPFIGSVKALSQTCLPFYSILSTEITSADEADNIVSGYVKVGTYTPAKIQNSTLSQFFVFRRFCGLLGCHPPRPPSRLQLQVPSPFLLLPGGCDF